MNTKYEITDIAHEKYPFLHRIRALRDIGSEVKAGDLGGFVECESNLSFELFHRWHGKPLGLIVADQLSDIHLKQFQFHILGQTLLQLCFVNGPVEAADK